MVFDVRELSRTVSTTEHFFALFCVNHEINFTCRYMERNQNENINALSNATRYLTSSKINPISIISKSNCDLNVDLYAMIRENALFLLELSSTTSSEFTINDISPVLFHSFLILVSAMLSNTKRSPACQMPIVSEHQIVVNDLNRPGTSRSTAQTDWQPSNRYSLRSFKSSSHKSETMSPDLMWQTSEEFACLESLGASIPKETTPFAMFGYATADSNYDRSLSDIGLDIVDGATGMTSSSMSGRASSQSKFHRSMSMGQGWSSGALNNRANNHRDDIFDQKVVLRRKNISDNDASSTLCQPSENLRKLVPEEIFNFNAAIQSYSKIAANLFHSKDVLDSKNENDDGNATGDFGVIDVEQKADALKSAAFAEMQNLLLRPTLMFCFQSHNLERLRCAMKRNLRMAACRIYALQALNWLVRSVTQTTCLHDLMWWFVSSLTSTGISAVDEANKHDEQALDHPIASMKLGGKMSQLLTQSLHAYLKSIADVTLLLPSGLALQQLAIQCFGIRFQQSDHHFLHQSHVFGNISKILSKSDELREQQNEEQPVEDASSVTGTKYSTLVDMSDMFEVNVSSRQAMASALVDNSTETFWESDEEDRNKAKTIEISLTKFDCVCRMIFIHIDNTRDVQNKVTNILFYGGQSLGDTTLIKSYDVNSKTGSWISTHINDDSFIHFRIELKGSETLRVRQIKLLGQPVTDQENGIATKSLAKQTDTIQIQHRNCESETLRVFRLLTAQVFGKLILGQENDRKDENELEEGGSTIPRSVTGIGILESNATSMLADSLDLREHMVGILFSRSKLSHLQKQVIVHIVQAIRKETLRARDEWETLNATATFSSRANYDVPMSVSEYRSESCSENSRGPDVYCFEMLSMVLALSGSSVGRSYLSNQHGLLKDLLTLLHTGSDRVQRQVTALLRRILPEVSPEQVADLLVIKEMPPKDFSIANQSNDDFDMDQLNILDIFLAVIAKALQLQVKIKSNAPSTGGKQPISLQLCNCIDLKMSELKVPKRKNDFQRFEQIDVGTEESIDSEHAALRCEAKNRNQRWFMKGTSNIKQAENIITLIRDMANVSTAESNFLTLNF